ncbi:hypothetical protein L6164_025296 [Bauhinia variegata]|uniref:Uncharacterized protein n=1 Tax=Bauhinia variegata TaxID=167791 RepID=A0ACB9M044_BAUVA|nr:hypothetical protein L6164_025296 [Bauhinia variegata]
MYLLQMCSGVDENTIGGCAQLAFAPIDESFPDDAVLLPSGFRVIPLDAKTIQKQALVRFDIVSDLEATLERMESSEFRSVNFSQNDFVKDHLRCMPAVLRTFSQRLSRGFNDAVNGFVDDGWSLMVNDEVEDVTIAINSSPNKFFGSNYKSPMFPSFGGVVLCAKASILLQNVPPAMLVRFLREHRSEWADYGVDAYSAASLKASPYAVPCARPGGFPSSQVILALAHTIEHEEFEIEGHAFSPEDEALARDMYLLCAVELMTMPLGGCEKLAFAPIDESFPDDAVLLPSGFRVIPLDAKTIQKQALSQKYNFNEKAIVFYSVRFDIVSDLEAMLERMESSEFRSVNFSQNDLVKDHLRYMPAVLRTFYQRLSRGFNDPVNGFVDDGWSLMGNDGVEDVTMAINSSPNKFFGSNYKSPVFPSFGGVVLCAKASMLLQSNDSLNLMFRGFNDAVNGFVDDVWSLMGHDGVEDVTIAINSSPNEFFSTNYKSSMFPSFGDVVLYAKASMLLQKVPPAMLVRFLREHHSEWADYGVDAYSIASLKASPYAVPCARPGGFPRSQVIFALAHTIEHEEFEIEGHASCPEDVALARDMYLLQMCSGVYENAIGGCEQLAFAPIDESFADDAVLLPSGFRVIPLDAKTIQ